MTQRRCVPKYRRFPVTDHPGPGGAHARGNHGDCHAAGRIQVHEVLPVTMAFAAASTAMGYRDRLVAVYHEGEIRDSMSNELISQVVHQGLPTNWTTTASKSAWKRCRN